MLLIVNSIVCLPGEHLIDEGYEEEIPDDTSEEDIKQLASDIANEQNYFDWSYDVIRQGQFDWETERRYAEGE